MKSFIVTEDRGRTNGPLDQKTKKPTVESFLNFFRSIIGRRGSGFRFERLAEFSRNKASAVIIPAEFSRYKT